MKRILLIVVCGILSMMMYVFADSTPVYPGGKSAMEQYFATNMKYPEAAKQNGIEGIVSVSFVVNTDGTIGVIKIVRLIDPDLEQEAIRLVKNMPKWTPAEKDGKAVSASVDVDIPFQIPE